MQTGSHMVSFKKHGYALFSALKWGRREIINEKPERKRKQFFLFYSQDTSCLENQLKAEPQFSLKIYFQKTGNNDSSVYLKISKRKDISWR